MSDLIDKQMAIDELTEPDYENGEAYLQYEEDIKTIKNLPSAQPEIIRCKDCKYYGRADKRRFYRGMDCLNKHIDTIVPERDFCSRAERRTDERSDR